MNTSNEDSYVNIWLDFLVTLIKYSEYISFVYTKKDLLEKGYLMSV